MQKPLILIAIIVFLSGCSSTPHRIHNSTPEFRSSLEGDLKSGRYIYAVDLGKVGPVLENGTGTYLASPDHPNSKYKFELREDDIKYTSEPARIYPLKDVIFVETKKAGEREKPPVTPGSVAATIAFVPLAIVIVAIKIPFCIVETVFTLGKGTCGPNWH